jgi:E3 ubiquitin-protein ligase TRIP12
MADLLSPVLVRLSRHDSNPDIMLLAIRALTYLCDVFPRASVFLVRHDAIPAICQRLMAIEYLDVAEQVYLWKVNSLSNVSNGFIYGFIQKRK